MRWDIGVDGNPPIVKGHYIDGGIQGMKKWVISALKKSAQHGVITTVTLAVEDKITPSHFIKHTFSVAVVGVRGGVDVNYEKK